MRKNRFCCAIVLYNPSQEELARLDYYSKHFEFLYVFDNTEKQNNNYLFCKKDNIEYITVGCNKGLPYAYNVVCNKAINRGFDFICLLDQDSNFPAESIEILKKYIEQNYDENIGIYAPKIVLQGEIIDCSDSESYIADWVISSGSFLSLLNYKKTAGFDEFYFIDRVDYEYCQKLNKIGCKILVLNNSVLYQQLGEYRKVFGFKFYQHSKIRHYYIFRNRIYYYLISQPFNIKNLLITVVATLKHFLLILLSETGKFQKIKQFFKAFKSIADYKRKL